MQIKKYVLMLSVLLLPAIIFSQAKKVTLSGQVKNKTSKAALAYVNVVLSQEKDSSFVAGVVTGEDGRFSIANVAQGDYLLTLSYASYQTVKLPVTVGRLSEYLNMAAIDMQEDNRALQEVVVSAITETVLEKMDKKTFSLSDNISQGGGSVLQSMKNLPGVTVNEDGKVLLRGSDKITVLIDGKQTALTGFGNQNGLDNIPASAIDKIEIINNPSAKYDANGNAGIINIIYKKSKQQGFNGKIGITAGLGALREKKENFPTIRPQYQNTPKYNPSLSINYRKNKVNLFLQADYLYNKTLNRNDFGERFYTNGDTIKQQVKRNRITTVGTVKGGLDWYIDADNSITVSGLYSSEYVRDSGDIPYFNSKLTQRMRLWQFYEDEVNSAATASAAYQHKFKQPGHLLNVSLNYTFHREDEKYFLTNIMPTFTGRDTFMLIADENVTDLNIDYVRPLKHGRIETGTKFRWRYIPTNMRFFPGINSPLDKDAAGWAKYDEIIPAVYGNYVYENKKFELEAGLRFEYVNLDYTVNPNHNTYRSDGYNYLQPFPSLRLGYNASDKSKFSFFYNRRVDRPDEGDIRIFPKYDEPEVLKVGNPGLRPQFTQSFELGFKNTLDKGYFYSAVYHRRTKGAITRIGTTVPGSNIIYNIFQNAKNAFNTGVEMIYSQDVSKAFSFNINGNIYHNTIGAFSVINKYPTPVAFSAGKETSYSGNAKLNAVFRLRKKLDIQFTTIYLAPDIIPQGKIDERFSVDLGAKKSIQKGKGELFLNASDLLGTLRIKKEITGSDFKLISTDYYETQVIRLGYSYKF